MNDFAMTRLVRVELLKLRTTRAPYGLLATAAGLVVFFALLGASRAGNGTSGFPPLATVTGQSTVTTVTSWTLLMTGLLGVITAAGEFRHGTATLTYVLTPSRGRVLIAKAIAVAMAGACFGLVSASLATTIGLSYTAADGDSILLGAGTIAAHIAGTMLAAALFGAIGAAVGSLVRSQLVGVIAILVWSMLIESLIGGLFTAVRPYLPYMAATTLAGVRLGAGAFGPGRAGPAGGPLPFAASAALVAAVALALSYLAARVTVPRDVT